MTFDLYREASISPAELITATHVVADLWPTARLHKNEVTKNLTIMVDGKYVGMLDLLDATVHRSLREFDE